MVTGGREVYHGIKSHNKKKILSGAFDMAIGAAVSAVALGGGLPAGIALGAIFITKMAVVKRHEYKESTVKTFNTAGRKIKSLFIRDKELSVQLDDNKKAD